jgi:hypothetical protein
VLDGIRVSAAAASSGHDTVIARNASTRSAWRDVISLATNDRSSELPAVADRATVVA